jgi:8-oxo-dGTP diphosphatase
MIEVVVGVIRNDSKEIFITKRMKNQFMSGYWELPGGKVENYEKHSSAIEREMFEETGIKIEKYSLFQTIQQQYPSKTINLSVYVIEKYSGTPVGKEGQDFLWSRIDELEKYKLLPTMWKIFKRLSLPTYYWITPDNHKSNSVLEQCNQRFVEGVKIIQLRSKSQLKEAYIEKFYKLCQLNQSKLILNMPHISFDEPCDGWHLTSNKLMSSSKKQFPDDKLIGASAHNMKEVMQAEKILVDYVSLSPINKTLSHPETKPLGWERVSQIISQCQIPVYLLGGMEKDFMEKALIIGAQGIAGIRGL